MQAINRFAFEKKNTHKQTNKLRFLFYVIIYLTDKLAQKSTQLAASAMWEIGLVVYARREHSGRLACIETATKATGIAGLAGNKGAGSRLAFASLFSCYILSFLSFFF